jgi:hypothetical protein
MTIWSKVRRFFQPLTWKFLSSTTRTRVTYSINGKEVSEEEWYTNGGADVEKELDEALAEMERIKKHK